MCIRDSPAVLALVTIAALVDVARFGGVAPVGLLNFLVVWSVSYTHLRAHETVLDLVCRLLLEKNLDSS